MKAARFVGDNKIQVIDVPIPSPGAHEVLVKVAFCGLCGSERRVLKAGFPGITPGHEISGTVQACGDTPAPLEKGTPVLIYLSDFCGTCEACATMNTSQCSAKKRLVGWHFDGGYAEYVLVPRHMVFPIGSLPLEHGVLALDTVGTAFHGLRLGDIRPEHSVLVIGCGPIGLGCVSILHNHYHIQNLYAADTSAYHLRLAGELGATQQIAVDPSDTPGSIAAALHGFVDRVIEVVGVDGTLAASMKCVAPGGRIVLIGEPEKALTLQRSTDWVLKDFSLVNSWYFPVSEMEENLQYIREHADEVGKLASHRFGIQDMEHAYELFGQGLTGKVLIHP